jgi:16S rRNA (cytidine1402-2'-O)-methyltransferase
MRDVLGDRRVVLARELTKIHEELLRGKIGDIIEKLAGRSVKGEITLVVEGRTGDDPELSVLSLSDHVAKLIREEGVTKKDAIEMVAKLGA